MKTYKRKTRDIFEIQGYYNNMYGYETVNTEETFKDAKRSLKEYAQNEPGIPFKIVKVRENIKELQKLRTLLTIAKSLKLK